MSGASRRTARPPNARNFHRGDGRPSARRRTGIQSDTSTCAWWLGNISWRQTTRVSRTRLFACSSITLLDPIDAAAGTEPPSRGARWIPCGVTVRGRRSRSSVAPARRRCSFCATTRRTSPGISFWAWEPCRWRPLPDWSWSENRLVPLYPEGPSARAAHSGESTGFLVVRCAASSPMPRCETWPEPRRFWPNAKSPPPAPSEPYLHKVQSSTFVYFQVCGARDLPLTREGEPTNVRATVALNSHRMVHRTAVQEDVLADSVWTPEVFSFARNPNSAFITVRVYGNLTKMWDPDALAVFAKDATWASWTSRGRPRRCGTRRRWRRRRQERRPPGPRQVRLRLRRRVPRWTASARGSSRWARSSAR